MNDADLVKLMREWADDFEAAAHEIPKGIKSTILMTRAQQVRQAIEELTKYDPATDPCNWPENIR